LLRISEHLACHSGLIRQSKVGFTVERLFRALPAVCYLMSTFMVDTLRSKLNPLYASLFASPGVFDRPEIVEKRATCDTCAMCDQGQLAPVEMDYFKPDTKC